MSGRKEINAPIPPQPRRPGKLSKRSGSEEMDEEEVRPGLPPRRPTVDLLAGEGDELVGGWTALKPN